MPKRTTSLKYSPLPPAVRPFLPICRTSRLIANWILNIGCWTISYSKHLLSTIRHPVVALSTLLGLIILLPSFTNAQPTAGQTVDKIVAKVDNYIVLKSDLEGALQEAQRNSPAGVNYTRCQILQQLVIEKLLLAKAEIDSVVVEEPRVESELARRLQYMTNAYGQENIEEQFGKSIEEIGEDLRVDIRDQLVVQQMQSTITQDIK